ncbi:MAG: hypothetical protein FWE42_01355 [Defluviitaleaceae bacterium]|nr:hypothetical protein [Defluviitaleaceae bacterium]
MRKNGMIILLIVVLMVLVGCSSSNTLSAIDPGDIDKIHFVQAMGNPAYGADSKIITERSEIAAFVAAFNNAVIGDAAVQEVGFHATILFYSGDEVAYQFFFNVNDTERVLLNSRYSRFYYVEYPGLTPFELYLASSAEVIVVDENLIEIERPLR